MLEDLKQKVFTANMALPAHGLVVFTWGNVSAIDRDKNIVAIKPSGVEYEKMQASDMVLVDLDGNKIEGDLKPSSDLKTHLALYKAFGDIGGVVHTHSTYATAFSQAGKGIAPFGTTHADYFYGEIPVTRSMTNEEIAGDYELETGNVIIETFKGIEPLSIPGVLVNSHGPFAWGKDADNAVHNAVVLEQICQMAYLTLTINPNTAKINSCLLDKHFLRKHGKNAYYGQS